MAITCEICSAPVARWQNMPGHYRRAHPDVLLPEAIARFGLKHSPRPRLRGQQTQRALPQPGQRVQSRISQRVLPRPSYRALPRSSQPDGRYVASLPVDEGRFRSILDDEPLPVKQVVASEVEKKSPFSGWFPWVLAGVVLFLILGGSVEIGSSDEAQGNSRLVSSYQPEGAGQ